MKNIIGTLIKKLSSRKLWTALAGVVTGLSIVFGADQGAAGTVSGAVVSALSVLTYIVTEGKLDAAAVAETVTKVQEAAAVMGKNPEQKE